MLGFLAVVTSVLISLIHSTTHSLLNFYEPSIITPIIKCLQSIVFFSEFYSLNTAVISTYLCTLYETEYVHTHIPFAFFIFGMMVFGFIWSFLDEGAIFYGTHRDGVVNKAPSSLYTPTFVAYEIPHVIFIILFVASCVYIWRMYVIMAKRQM